MIQVFLLYFIFASTFTLGKAALAYLAPFLLIGVRMLLGGFLLLLYYFLCAKQKIMIKKQDYYQFIQIIFFHIFISYTLEFWALEYVTSAKVCLLYNLSPFITALFSYFLFQDRLKLRQLVGLIIGFVGFLPILMAEAPLELTTQQIFFLSYYEIALLFSVISGAYGWIVMKNLTTKGYAPIFINGVAMTGGGMLSLVLSFIKEGWPRITVIPETIPEILRNVDPTIAALIMLSIYLFALILISNVIFYNLYAHLARHYSLTLLSFCGFVTPLFAALLGWFFLGEVITWHFFATVSCVMIGLYLFYKDEL